MKSTIQAMLTVLFLVFLSTACSPEKDEDVTALSYDNGLCTDTTGDYEATNGSAPSISSWLYQLQDTSTDDLSSTGFDLFVIDYSPDGTDENRYTANDLASFHTNSKTVLAYLSIGEAEDYRYYFNSGWVSNSGLPSEDSPCWLARANTDWPGNYKVEYWSNSWQEVIEGYLDKIIDAGFDGVYLDIVDAFEYWSDPDNGEGYQLSEAAAAGRMINFVKRIAYHARVVKGKSDFYIFPQNGEEILDHDSKGDFLTTISGIGIEDLYYDETTEVSSSIVSARESYLDQIKNAGKTVLIIDYVDDNTGYSANNKTRIDEFYSIAQAKGYFPYAAVHDRDLDEINTIVGLQE